MSCRVSSEPLVGAGVGLVLGALVGSAFGRKWTFLGGGAGGVLSVVAVLAKVNFKKEPEPVDPVPPALQMRELCAQVQKGELDLGSESIQYNHRGENADYAGQSCSFNACELLVDLSENFEEWVAAWSEGDTAFFSQKQQEGIARGAAKRKEWNADRGVFNEHLEPPNPDELDTVYPQLKIPQEPVVVASEIIRQVMDARPASDVLEEMIFCPVLANHVMNSYKAVGEQSYGQWHSSYRAVLVLADGQTFLLFQIDQEKAFLVDTHKSSLKVVDREEAARYIEEKESADLYAVEIAS